ncbi:glucose-1-phosphate adenylyltransferase [Sporobacter termitidis DSM 10068]|uniref:Glucose-1-phosphate adenylyltransferase n=1 Tax=Sporobacter termitidis DSM 10068 TaxID=1123282 RepID=A0A1M5YNH5_9FIRM|nr:glucose-1-phosphate adenylyltransferase subunit GlgD [Sporobacter termitidis]SHI13491.1 glucose-1-phosphate adenylyltransferase [Sporobacter termitidis DSM 10068]
MKRMMGIIAANYQSDSFAQLTKDRPVASLPFGGRYRLVDFPLSNMVNSGIFTVGLITPYMYRSIMDHVGVGKEWALSRKVGGMFILPGSIYGLKNVQGKFLLRDILRNRPYLDRSNFDLVVISGCSKVFNIDFQDVAEQHTASGADITLIYKKTDAACGTKELYLDVAENGEVTAAHDAPIGADNCFMDAFIMSRDLLLKFISWYEETSYLDLTDIIVENLSHLYVSGYEFTGYMGNADSVACYMRCSQELLNPEVNRELFRPDRPIITKIQDSPPAKYWPAASVRNALVSSGCIIKGTVENSIIFRGVTIEEHAVVRNAVVMQNTVIHRESILENVICDKYAVIRPGVKLFGNPDAPILVGKGQDV